LLPAGALDNRLRKSLVDLSVAWDRFLTLSVGPNIVAAAAPQKTPAAGRQALFQVASLHVQSVH